MTNASTSATELEKLLQREREADAVLEGGRKRRYMSLLNRYNEVKDAAQIIMGVIANVEGVTVKKVHESFHLPLDD